MESADVRFSLNSNIEWQYNHSNFRLSISALSLSKNVVSVFSPDLTVTLKFSTLLITVLRLDVHISKALLALITLYLKVSSFEKYLSTAA